MHIKIDSKIRIYKPVRSVIIWLKENYTIPNPEYITRSKLNLYKRNISPKLPLYEKVDDDVYNLPYGCLRELYAFLKNFNLLDKTTFEIDVNKASRGAWMSADIKLRDYQIPAVDRMVNRKFGILKAPCGSGKTVMGHAIAKRIGMRTLWLTHTSDLLKQSMAEGIRILGSDMNIGTITEGKVNIGQTITYATIQTMAKMKASTYATKFNCVIVDECHRCNTKKSSSQMARVVNNIKAEYKFGLSATPETHDGYFRTVLCNLGNIEYEIPDDVLKTTNMIMPVDIKPVFSNYTYSEEVYNPDGTIDWNMVVQTLIADAERNKLILNQIEDSPTIILTNRVQHIQYIVEQMDVSLKKRTIVITPSAAQIDHDPDVMYAYTNKTRDTAIKDVRDGKYDVVLATYQLAKEGLNIPRLEKVIFALLAIEQNIIIQSIGRVARTYEGKTQAVCIDIVDKPRYFQKKYRERLRLYRDRGYNIIE